MPKHFFLVVEMVSWGHEGLFVAWTGGVCIDGQCLVLAELFGSCTSYHKIPKFVALLRVFRPVARNLCVGPLSIALSSARTS